jgi:hypothetical protein
LDVLASVQAFFSNPARSSCPSIKLCSLCT